MSEDTAMPIAARQIRMFRYAMVMLRQRYQWTSHRTLPTLEGHERDGSRKRIAPWRSALCVVAMAALASACASPKVGYDYDRSADFTTYRTYAWMPDSRSPTGDRRIDNDLVDARIRAAVDRQLRGKGYTNPAAGKPDFYVAYHAAVTDMMKGASTQRYIGDRASGLYTTVSDIQPYKGGALLIDIVDGATQRLVWQGTASAEVDPGMTAAERDARIARVVNAMFEQFPPH
ncbi:MAG: DUF4136 domain-containing protein [Nitrospira sp.]|nr:DUF4136 domain-containing protein [Nitrospira sp.]